MQWSLRRALLNTWLLCLLSVAVCAQQIAPVITVDHGPNALIQESKHYVIMVSLDGFRSEEHTSELQSQ